MLCQDGCCPRGNRNDFLPSSETEGRNPRQVAELVERNKPDPGREGAYQQVRRPMSDRENLNYTNENSDALAGSSAAREQALCLFVRPQGPFAERHPAANRLRPGAHYHRASEPSPRDYRARPPATAVLLLAARDDAVHRYS